MKALIQVSILLFCFAMFSGIALAQVNTEYAQVAEDTDIMATIIDKTMKKVFNDEYRESGFFDAGCQGIFLKGYGVLFMMKVGFPVVKLPEENPVKENKQEDLWDQTKRELKEGPSKPFAYGSNSSDNMIGGGGAPASYDQTKVDQLKNELLRLIGDYSNNIRSLQPDNNVSIIIKGGGKFNFSYEYPRFSVTVPSVGVVTTPAVPAQPNVSVITKASSGISSTNAMPASPPQPSVATGTKVTVPSAVPPLPPQSSIDIPPVESIDIPPVEVSDNVSEATSTSVPEQRVEETVQEAQRAKMKAYDLQQKANELQKRTYEIQSKIGDLVLPNQMLTGGAKTTMIIVVKKRNVMDFKEGRINFDEFAKRAEIIQY